MARKSRTQPKQSPDTLNVLSKVYKTAIYVRLSAEKMKRETENPDQSEKSH